MHQVFVARTEQSPLALTRAPVMLQGSNTPNSRRNCSDPEASLLTPRCSELPLCSVPSSPFCPSLEKRKATFPWLNGALKRGRENDCTSFAELHRRAGNYFRASSVRYFAVQVTNAPVSHLRPCEALMPQLTDLARPVAVSFI